MVGLDNEQATEQQVGKHPLPSPHTLQTSIPPNTSRLDLESWAIYPPELNCLQGLEVDETRVDGRRY
ncbi:hypothetical protein HETIRDRAFT_143769 [Heterobasidion irregulare TC 32-1]|uniref:Uncharacterized protein n=1 Tax=Heterobasidion irregulare (strain TC 32-1) TaxID=747525 RepID=W4JTN9_HETIT|nr:uncharacterized protein HETIRDRAFT_143769 [Heterobasidion irregulare TC 32-1]ETW76804.1 hypothetical protein HETIRDRAFT_143769 [Heterobasidion irregulare TC 32-1]